MELSDAALDAGHGVLKCGTAVRQLISCLGAPPDRSRHSRRPRHAAEHRADVAVLVFLLKQDVALHHFGLLDAPLLSHHVRRRVRYDERIERHVGVAEPLLDLLHGLVKADLRIGQADVSNPFGIHEGHVLAVGDELPEDEVRVEVPRLEESDPATLAQVAEQARFRPPRRLGRAAAGRGAGRTRWP